MKVICIDAVSRNNTQDLFKIKEGFCYIVEQDKNHSDTFWIKSLGQGYCKWRFIPLSTIDETEIHSKIEKQLL